jgi:hypothetical protein
MLFGYLTLATALIISLSAAVYSILGLTAIFAAAFWPIVIMGGSLEFGKIITTLWLHKYWDRAEIQYKVYLCSAVAILMLLTSMGVFGFLSKAHTDQSLVSGDVTSKIAIYDEKIKIERDNIDANRKQLKQMDEAVDQTMARSSSEGGADKAVAIRRGQQKERGRLLQEITESQKKITALNEQRAPIAADVRKVEAEVGPIKYIAALVYGDNPDANVLEKAVRWVIILIVIVFDPLALTLLLAATKSLEWERGIAILNAKKRIEEEADSTFTSPLDNLEPVFDRNTHIPVEDYYRAMNTTDENLIDPYIADSTKKPRWAGFGFPMLSIFNKKEDSETREFFERAQDRAQAIDAGTYQAPAEPIEQPVIDDGRDEVHHDDPEKEAKRRWKEENPNNTIKRQIRLKEVGAIADVPWHNTKYNIGLQADNEPHGPTGEVKGFGTAFPTDANKGDMFLRVDQLPTQLYKFNGIQWIAVDKGLTDNYAYDDAYIDHLIDKIDSGEYDLDLLSDAERDAIEAKLKR